MRRVLLGLLLYICAWPAWAFAGTMTMTYGLTPGNTPQWAHVCASLKAASLLNVSVDGEPFLSSTRTGGGYNSQTIAGKTTAGTNRVGIVHVSSGAANAPNISSVTWNGVSMTPIVTTAVPNFLQASLYQIVAPPTGASTITVVWATNFTGNSASAVAVSSYTGVDQSAPIEAFNSLHEDVQTPGPITITCPCSGTGLGVDAVGLYSAVVISQGAQQTVIQNTGAYGFGAWSVASWAFPLNPIRHRVEQE